MWDFEHPPLNAILSERYSIHSTSPANCARELATGNADIGLVPVAAYATIPSLGIVPGCAIASLDRVRSILLVTRESPGVEGVRTIAADTSSKTSLVYAQILFRKYWNPAAEFREHAPNLDAMLERCDAALLIGDPALLALEDQSARQQRSGERLLYLDLAHEWKFRTGCPWVSAFWAVRPGALDRSSITAAEIVADFTQSRDHGLAHIEDLVGEWSGKISLPAAIIRTYLAENIHYVLDEACLNGLEAFYRYAAEYAVLPPAPQLRFL